MKRLIYIISLTLFVCTGYAQKIQVSESAENINSGNRNSVVVIIPEVSVEDVEKAWKGELKNLKSAKVSYKKGEFMADDATHKDMGENSFDLYARVDKEGDDAVKLIVSVDLGGAYMSSGQHPEQFKVFKDLAYKFAVRIARETLDELLKDETKNLESLTKVAATLVTEKTDLEASIEDYKKKIEEAEAAIEENIKSQEAKKEEVLEQEQVVKAVEEKMKGVK